MTIKNLILITVGKNTYHIVFIMKVVCHDFFNKQKHKFRFKNFTSFFGWKLTFLLKFKFYDKKNFTWKKFEFLFLWRSSGRIFLTQKIQKTQKNAIFSVNAIFITLFHLLRLKWICKKNQAFFLKHQNFQTENYLAIWNAI